MANLYRYDGENPAWFGGPGSFEPGSRPFKPGERYWLEHDDKVLAHLPFALVEPPDYDVAPTLAGRVDVLQTWLDTVGDGLKWHDALPLAGAYIERLVGDALRAGSTEESPDTDALTEKDLRLYLNRVKAWAAESGGAPEAERDEQAADNKDWILVSEAVSRLPFIRNLKALYKYAEKHPDKLMLRPHPEHPKRRQANAADVLRLEIEHDRKQLDAMDRPGAEGLPSLSEGGIEALAKRMAEARATKRK
jgi:hypothetical protein